MTAVEWLCLCVYNNNYYYNSKKSSDSDVVFCSYMNFYEQYSEFDAFITSPEPSNPWTSDNVEFWEQELTTSVSSTVCL